MAKETKEVWLKVLIGFIISVMVLLSTIAYASMNRIEEKKLNKTVFRQHEKYQSEQFNDIKASLKRIEDKI